MTQTPSQESSHSEGQQQQGSPAPQAPAGKGARHDRHGGGHEADFASGSTQHSLGLGGIS